MSKLKKLIIIASALVIVGLIGSLYTFRSVFHAEEIKEEIEIDELFTDISISTDNASIRLVATDEEKASIIVTGKANNHKTYDLTTSVVNEQLFIDLDDARSKLFTFYPRFLTLTVKVPKDKLGSIQIEIDNGRTQIENLEAAYIQVEADNGAIEMKNTIADEIVTDVSNGAIELSHVLSNSVHADTDNGKVTLNHVSGDLFGDVNNGTITLHTDDLDRSIEFDTDNGEIKIFTEKEPTNASIQAFVDNGKVSIFKNSSKNNVFGKGENLIQLTTNNGSIKVEKK